MGYVQGITGIAQVRTFSVLLHCSSAKTQCFILSTLLLLDGGSFAGRLDGRQVQTGLHPERGSCIGCHCWCKFSNHALVQAACECAVWRLCFAWHLHWFQQCASGSPIRRLHSKGEKVGPFAGQLPLPSNSNGFCTAVMQHAYEWLILMHNAACTKLSAMHTCNSVMHISQF